uniref:Abnormal cell migration protein 18-like fibronectin type I domain-containing protein n=1 Tax=Romanomermis culicivorax TaxID=13658 RepID=A0A915HQY0_ROMCU
MQMRCAIFILVNVLAAFSWAAQEPKICAGGYREGDRVDRGRYWYVCQNGQLMPKGCFSNDYTRLNVYESYHSDGYAISCVFDENGYLGFAYKACVYDGREYYPGATWDEQNAHWFTCVQEGDSLRTEMSGCIHNNARYKVGEKIQFDEFVYQCRRYANNTCNMTPVGCIHQGRRYHIGDSIEQDKYWYACTIEDGK